MVTLASKVTIALAGMCAAFAVAYCCSANSLHSAPTDEELIRIFQAHRGDIERLRQMATEDMSETSFLSASNISKLLPASRRNEYRELLKLSPGLQVGANYDGSVRFIFASTGQAISPGWAKGIQFIPDKAKSIGTRMDTLDGSANLPAGVYLREIEPQWFLFYQRDE